jgi:hypothetical protein
MGFFTPKSGTRFFQTLRGQATVKDDDDCWVRPGPVRDRGAGRSSSRYGHATFGRGRLAFGRNGFFIGHRRVVVKARASSDAIGTARRVFFGRAVAPFGKPAVSATKMLWSQTATFVMTVLATPPGRRSCLSASRQLHRESTRKN